MDKRVVSWRWSWLARNSLKALVRAAMASESGGGSGCKRGGMVRDESTNDRRVLQND